MEDDLLSAGLACLRGQWPIAMAHGQAQGREPWAWAWAWAWG